MVRGRWAIAGGIATVVLALAAVAAVSVALVRFVGSDSQSMLPQAHRAIYDLTLDHGKSAGEVLGLEGRMVVEWRGGPACDGYTSDQRVVTNSLDSGGHVSVSDVRLSSWEALDGDEFRFDRTEYLDGKLSTRESGIARRKDGKVTLEEPDKETQILSSDVMFPTAFNTALTAAVGKGKSAFSHLLFDGTQATATNVTAFIGKAGDATSDARSVRIKNRGEGMPLKGTKAWPIRMSYFDQGDDVQDGTPSFEMGFHMFPNGVMSQLSLDYEDVVLNGNLAQIEYFKPGGC
ncbi:MAG TPA: DUF1849 family protein [Parvibaculum sp.]|jgi:hypothetical protein